MQKKALGQSFLRNPKIISNFIDSLELNDTDRILEIGGGDGAVTEHLIQKPFKSLKIIEIDSFFYSKLKDKYSNIDNVEILNLDFLRYTIPDNMNCIIGAIPYYITSPIVHILMRNSLNINKIGLIIQKEVAEKIYCENNKTLSYWNLITYFYDKKFIEIIPSYNFHPEPKVDSASMIFIKDDIKYKEFNEVFANFDKLSKFAHQLFLNPRKMLSKTFNKELLFKAEIDYTLRPHQLTVNQAIKLYKINK